MMGSLCLLAMSTNPFKCSCEYTEPQGLLGLLISMARVCESIRLSSCSRSASQPFSACMGGGVLGGLLEGVLGGVYGVEGV